MKDFVRVKNELAVVRKAVVDAKKLLKELEEGMQVVKVEACWMWEEKEAVEAKCKNTEQERNQLKKELEELQAVFEAQKKKLEELRVGFIVEKKELEKNYQKQIDEMFFFGYQYCMRKNDIIQDILRYPSDEEENATVSGPTQEEKDPDATGPSGQWFVSFVLFFSFVLLCPNYNDI